MFRCHYVCDWAIQFASGRRSLRPSVGCRRSALFLGGAGRGGFGGYWASFYEREHLAFVLQRSRNFPGTDGALLFCSGHRLHDYRHLDPGEQVEKFHLEKMAFTLERRRLWYVLDSIQV